MESCDKRGKCNRKKDEKRYEVKGRVVGGGEWDALRWCE
jgi:hypothetical protein